MEQYRLKSSEFRNEREDSWRALEKLVQRAETHGLGSLSHEQLSTLPSLYRGLLGSLSVARAISLDKNLLDYLTNLASRAHVVVYANKRRPSEAVVDFLLRGFPRAVRRHVVHLAAALLFLTAGVACGHLMTIHDMERYYAFVPDTMAQGRTPAATTESLREGLYSGREDLGEDLQYFASVLFTHNSKVGILCFTLGFAAGVPVVLLLFYNGLVLGAMSALFTSRGLGMDFWAWVMPHGVTELLAVALCGMAGLVFGTTLVFPGERSRLDNLAHNGHHAATAVLGAVAMLFIAALIEGFFRQLVQSIPIRWAVTLTTLALWTFYFGWIGREHPNEG
ncbi:hypothetical protein ABI59_09955 [Acidobacteria bacterium Mor1]|nr:hypothetical protein ABI59_09955 [Acidobacteria bacterium Mor1]